MRNFTKKQIVLVGGLVSLGVLEACIDTADLGSNEGDAGNGMGGEGAEPGSGGSPVRAGSSSGGRAGSSHAGTGGRTGGTGDAARGGQELAGFAGEGEPRGGSGGGDGLGGSGVNGGAGGEGCDVVQLGSGNILLERRSLEEYCAEGECPASVSEAEAQVRCYNDMGAAYRRTGCGFTIVSENGGLWSRSYAFDENGSLVGTWNVDDIVNPPCNTVGVAAGTIPEECTERESCTLCDGDDDPLYPYCYPQGEGGAGGMGGEAGRGTGGEPP